MDRRGEQRNFISAIGGAALCAALFAWLCSLAPAIFDGMPFVFERIWVESPDIRLSFFIDGLSLLFGLIITGVGVMIFAYTASYFRTHVHGMRVHLILILFMLSMLGLVTADNIIAMFVFWELTTLTSYLLIGTQHREEKARKLALQALIVTGAGGLVFLAGLVLMALAAGTYQISEIIGLGFTDNALYGPVFILIVIGCFTKSAQFPFHFWLPNAMAAPSPISAYLHSATMVKAGIYMLARFSPALGGTDLWFWTLVLAGGITAVWASVLALRQFDLKLMMAYTTLMALGTATFLLGIGTEMTIIAALTFLLIHALYKAALFLVVGNLEKATGTRDWRELGRLAKVMPVTAMATWLAALSMAGVPPFLGFIGKEMTYEGVLAVTIYPIFAIASVMFAASLMAGVAFFFMARPFFMKPPRERLDYKKLSPFMVWPPFILAVGGMLAGLAAELLVRPLIQSAVIPVAGVPAAFDMKLWHGFETVLFLSMGTLVAGALIAWQFPRIQRAIDGVLARLPLSAEGGYNLVMGGILGFANLQTRLLQSGRQRFYIMIAFSTLSLLSLLVFMQPGFFDDMQWAAVWADLLAVPLYQWALCAFIAASIFVTVLSHSRLLAVCALGVMGTSIALLFVIFSAPDVAMTQFMIEILVVILVTIVIIRLPPFSGRAHGSSIGRVRDAMLALTTGGIVTVLMLAVNALPFDRSITDYYEAKSYTEAYGQNIVNVILVDFRALDTLGEILVIALAGLACYGLVVLKRERSS